MCIYYTGYLTTNLINQKKYIGYHQTNNLDDGYLGSGTVFKQAVKKYGSDNFYKQIIQIFESAEEMKLWEKQTVTQETVDDPMYYNMKIGGEGGNNMKGRTHSLITRTKMSTSAKNRSPITDETRAKISKVHKGKIVSEEIRTKMSLTHKNISEETRTKLSLAHSGKIQSTDTRAKMSASHKGKKRKPFTKEHREKLSTAKQKKKLT